MVPAFQGAEFGDVPAGEFRVQLRRCRRFADVGAVVPGVVERVGRPALPAEVELLMIGFRERERRERFDPRLDRRDRERVECSLDGLALPVGLVEQHVVVLALRGLARRVVHPDRVVDERRERRLLGVVVHLDDLAVVADALVGRFRLGSAGVPDARPDHARERAERRVGTPEAPECCGERPRLLGRGCSLVVRRHVRRSPSAHVVR